MEGNTDVVQMQFVELPSKANSPRPPTSKLKRRQYIKRKKETNLVSADDKIALTPRLQGFVLPSATIEINTTAKKKRPVSRLKLPRHLFPLDFFSLSSSSDSDSESLSGDAARGGKMLKEIEIRGPTTLEPSKTSNRDLNEQRKQFSPPVVSPSRRLELTTRLGLSVLQEHLAQTSVDDSESLKTSESQGRLKTARLRSIGYIPIEKRPTQSSCLGIKSVASNPNEFKRSTRPSTVPVGYRLSMKQFEESLLRSYSARSRPQSKSVLSVSRDSGSVLPVQETGQENKQLTTQPKNEVSSPCRRPESAPIGPAHVVKKISSPIPTLRQDTDIDCSSSFHIRSYTPSETNRRKKHAQEATSNHSHIKASVLNTEGSHGLVITPQQLRHPRKPVVTLRNQGKWQTITSHPDSGPSNTVTLPVSKLSPLRGRLATEKVEPIIGSHIKATSKALPDEIPDSHSDNIDWIPPSPISVQGRADGIVHVQT